MEFSVNEGVASGVGSTSQPQEQQPDPGQRAANAEQSEAGALSAAGVLDSCLRRIRSWRVPPNWSAHDWFGEMSGQGAAALWQARCEYDPSRGVPLSAFERLRILAGARTRYRQEWRYALHCGSSFDTEQDDRWVDDAASSATAREPLADALAQIPEVDRRLIQQLFWAESTEAAVARQLGISQQAVSKRKAAVLKQLGRWLTGSAPEKNPKK
jgi:RNA polymerase sigma factor (sigma-70 family)